MRKKQSIPQREGIRQLPRVCWYPYKAHVIFREFKVAPRIDWFYSSLTEYFSVRGVFVFKEVKFMTVFPSLDEAKRIASVGEYKVLPVSCEILSDFITPIEAMKILKNQSKSNAGIL